jgi:hypothetical protein
MKAFGSRMGGWGAALALVLTSQAALAQEAAGPGRASPPRVRLLLGPAVTWREACARPGVDACSEWDALRPEDRIGDAVDFSSRVPYVGPALEVELFPLAQRASLLRGLGLALDARWGFPRTQVKVESPSGQTPVREVDAVDTAWGAMIAWRYFLDLGKAGAPLWGYGGVRLGVRGRSIGVRGGEDSALPEVDRVYPALGLDVSVPLVRVVRIEGAGQLFLRPNPDQVSDYGASVSSLGWAAELGAAGELWGPLGYSVRFRLERYQDRFEGQGLRRGWTRGGVAVDTFSSLQGGVTASW